MNQPIPNHIPIEVYEWKQGNPRPGSKSKPRHDCIDLLHVPLGQPVPQKGDVLQIRMPDDPQADGLGFVPFVVLEREFLSYRKPTKEAGFDKEDFSQPLLMKKLWIHVRRLEDYSLPADR